MNKVTLHFKNGGKMVFKCKKFTITTDPKGGYCAAEWTDSNQVITFHLDQVIGAVIKKVWF